MKNNIFREKSMERINSPEQLTDYIRVSNPGVWLLFTAIIVLLTGVCVWGIFGRIDTKLVTCAVSDGDSVICYIKEADMKSISKNMPVIIEGKEYTITDISKEPVSVGDDFNEYAMHIGDLKKGEWVYIVKTDAKEASGIYESDIIIDRVAPISFVFN